MIDKALKDLALRFSLPTETVAEDVRFVLGLGEGASVDDLTQEQVDLLQSYFHSVYGSGGYGTSIADSEELLDRLVVKNWRQFDDVDIDLTARLTIITGENGTGKTTLLNLIGQAFGEPTQILGTPVRDADGFRFRAGRRPIGEFDHFGVLSFRSGAQSKVGVREWQGVAQPYFSPEIVPYRQLAGLYLDAQRVIGPYQQLESIPPRFHSASEIAQAYKQQLRNLWIPHQLIKPPSLLIKEALVAAALYGEGNSAVLGDPRAAEVWAGFQDVLLRLFPESLGFKRLYVDQGEVIIETCSGSFALEAASGGLAAIVTLAWQIYLHAIDSSDAFTVCFDEPENHLHPSLQRTLLPSLLEAFPSVQFVVATHSPFAVTSTQNARVFALRRNSEGKVFSTQIDLEGQAFTANEILNEVLGVDVTLPIWAERKLQVILEDFRRSGSSGSVQNLVSRIEESGLRLTMPDVTEALADAIVAQDEDSSH